MAEFSDDEHDQLTAKAHRAANEGKKVRVSPMVLRRLLGQSALVRTQQAELDRYRALRDRLDDKLSRAEIRIDELSEELRLAREQGRKSAFDGGGNG